MSSGDRRSRTRTLVSVLFQRNRVTVFSPFLKLLLKPQRLKLLPTVKFQKFPLVFLILFLIVLITVPSV